MAAVAPKEITFTVNNKDVIFEVKKITGYKKKLSEKERLKLINQIQLS